jgi:hypothetical protein
MIFSGSSADVHVDACSLHAPCGKDATLPPAANATVDARSVSAARSSELILPCALHMMCSLTLADVADSKTFDS